MAGKFRPERRCVSVGEDERPGPVATIRSRTECLVQLLGAFRDIADLDDIHQAAERLDAVQAWIRREALAAADASIFEEQSSAALETTRLSA